MKDTANQRRFNRVDDMATPSNSCMYFGDHGEWWVVASAHRDSDSLSRSNYRVIRGRLESSYPESVRVERFNHWAVGWVDHLLVSGIPALLAAARMDAEIEQYPVLDESDWSELEEDDFWEWADGELSYQGPSWEKVVRSLLSENPDEYAEYASCDTVGWELIEAARSILEEKEALR